MVLSALQALQKGLVWGSDMCGRLVDIVVAGLALSMAAVIFSQVVSRYLLNHSLFWSEELGRCLLVWVTFLGACAAYKRSAHARIDVAGVLSCLPGRWGGVSVRTANMIGHLAGLGLFYIMIRYGFAFFTFLKFQQTTSLGVSKQVPFVIVPISGIILFLHGLAFFMTDIVGQSDDGRPNTISGGT
ncbi:TRAP transporter small permease [Desulfovibrio inopinatus]|uniref:TRAP transporter small permease n=1 Tax=Desulfovibrio inopinatus TaxID=102109 RepID=UPI0003FD3C41|nr:TRAP transporter small permease [Desulfovibrio inopinatus]